MIYAVSDSGLTIIGHSLVKQQNQLLFLPYEAKERKIDITTVIFRRFTYLMILAFTSKSFTHQLLLFYFYLMSH